MTNIRIDNQVDYWNSVSEHKQFTHPFNFKKFTSFVPTTASILDYGCGYGRILHELNNHAYVNLTGLDFSKQLILKGRGLFPFLDLQVIEPANIPYVDNYYDAVILFAVLTCVPDDDLQKKLMLEINRVLKPNGIIYISDYLLQQDKRNIFRYTKFQEKYNCYGIFELSDGGIVRHHTKEYMDKLVSPYLKLWEQEIEVITMNGHRSICFQYMGKS